MQTKVLQRIFLEFFFDMVSYPIWWYTAGAKQTMQSLVAMVSSANDRLAPMLWLKNIFVPMFGQYDWQGRLISFFMRLVNVIGREIALGCVACFGCMLFVAWVTFPLVCCIMLLISFT